MLESWTAESAAANPHRDGVLTAASGRQAMQCRHPRGSPATFKVRRMQELGQVLGHGRRRGGEGKCLEVGEREQRSGERRGLAVAGEGSLLLLPFYPSPLLFFLAWSPDFGEEGKGRAQMEVDGPLCLPGEIKRKYLNSLFRYGICRHTCESMTTRLLPSFVFFCLQKSYYFLTQYRRRLYIRL